MRRVAEDADRQAFEELFKYFAPRVKSYLVRSGASVDQADDLSQEAMVTVWRKAGQFDPAKAAVSTWIFAIARHLRIDAARRARHKEPPDERFDLDQLAFEQCSLGEAVHVTRLSRQVREALARLPAEQAQVLTLAFYRDDSHTEIAKDLQIPLGTVKGRIRLAVAHLRKLLDAR